MMRWSNVCLPKDFGGLGILNTRTLNEALILKWVWKLYNSDEEDLCCSLLRNKYLRNKPFACSKKKGGSQFWRGVQQVKNKFFLGASFQVGNRENIRFWVDTWLGEVALKLIYPKLFTCCRYTDITVSECWIGGEWVIDFRRTFGPAEVEEWDQLLSQLEGVHLSESPDKAIWRLEAKGVYSSRSMYRFISFGGVLDKRVGKLWRSKLPMKLKVFVWQAMHNRLPTGVVLKGRNWKGDINCPLCGSPETIDHILFQCIIARFVWACIKEALGWEKTPLCLEEVFRDWLPLGGAHHNLKFFPLRLLGGGFGYQGIK